MADALWRDGKSEVPQERATESIELQWADGKSGPVGLREYVAAGGVVIPVFMHHYRELRG
jgi:hypothetical protein